MNVKKVILIVASLLLLVVLVLGGFFLYRSSDTDQKMDAFQATVDTFKEISPQYNIGSYQAEYDHLIDQCNLCLSDRDTKVISILTERMKELKQAIITENKDIAEFTAQLSTYKNAASLYVLEGTNKNEYKRLIAEFEMAVKKSDTASCNSVSKQLASLISTLKTMNEKQTLEASNAAKEYKQELEKLQKKLDENKTKKDSGQTNIYITPKTEKKTIVKKEPEVVYVVPDNADFICPDSSTRYLTDADLKYLTSSQLRIARNEIYARYGRRFTSKDLQAYFDSKSWYYGYISPKEFDDDMLTKIENKNVAFIKKYEARYK